MTTRREVLLALGTSALATPLRAVAQTPPKIWKIGFLTGMLTPPDKLPPVPLRQAFAALGYDSGRTISYEGRWADARAARLPELAADLVKQRVDAIVALGWPATKAARGATMSIPIVMAFAGDAVGAGHVASLSHPGGNVTGISDLTVELSAKRLELLKETVPKISRIAVMWNEDDLGMTLRYREIDRAAHALGVTIQAIGVRAPDDFDAAFAAMKRERPDALFLVTDALTGLNRQRVIDFVEAHRIPAMYEFGSVVQEGGLMSYGPSPAETFNRIAYYVDRIFKGAKPGELPLEQPTKFELFINLKTAKALGIRIPDTIQLRADKVVE